MNKPKVDALSADKATLADDIDNSIDKNFIASMSAAMEINSKVKKLEEMRTTQRRNPKELKLILETKYEGCYEKSLIQKLEGQIKEANRKKQEMRQNNSKPEMKSRESILRSELFLVQVLNLKLRSLQAIFKINLSDLSDEELTKRKNDLPK